MVKQRKLNTPEKRARVGERIKVAATQAGISLKQLAEQTSVSPSAIYQYVRGITAVPVALLDRIAAVTMVHPSFFDPDQNARAMLALPTDASGQSPATLSVTEPHASSRVEAEFRQELALAEAQRGFYTTREGLLAGLERVLALARAMESRGHQAETLLKIAGLHQACGDPKTGAVYYAEARDLAGSDFPDIGAQAAIGLGHCLTAQGELSEASRLQGQISSTVHGSFEWRAAHLEGAILARRGDVAGALEAFEKSAHIAMALDSPQIRREAQQTLSAALAALAYREGHFGAALALWQQIALMAEREHLPHAYMEAVTEAARCQFADGDLMGARASLEKVIGLTSFWPAAEYRDIVARSLLADVQTAVGDRTAARESARTAVRTAHRSGSDDAIAVAELAMARVRLGSEQYAEAEEHASEASIRAGTAYSSREIAASHIVRAMAALEEKSSIHGSLAAASDPALRRALAEATAACNTARSGRDRATALHAQWAQAQIYAAMGQLKDAEAAAVDLLSALDNGPAPFSAALSSRSLAELLAVEVDVQSLFRPGARLDIPLLEWQVHALRGVLAESRSEPDHAYVAFLTAAEIASRIVSALTPAEARGFQQSNSRLVAVGLGLERNAAAAGRSADAHATLESVLLSKVMSGMAVVGAALKSAASPVE